ncbi:SagD family biosynthesis docking scaffold protein [Rhizocola hellebori]|uniref:SagD family biosynthesis docking scaffold protein n=1 Tax=Rhizocola hellebori TaxID=1392758 RepID=A0A8J3VGY8_9ACTN|nr:TOMM precursor leader peptide-binding protein [Rhizocola hellebori]GIH05368.1 SagD family biosynthesis docking scaffold protein [Rhizocola hellebori]
MSSAPDFVVVGKGRLGAAIAAELGIAANVSIVDDVTSIAKFSASEKPPAVVIVADGPEQFSNGHAPALPGNVSWTPVRVELGTVVIGPTVTPGVAGCTDCVEVRRSRARPDAQLHADARQRFPDRYHAPDPALTSFGVTVAARLTSTEVTGVAAGRLRLGTVRLRLNTMTVSSHRFLPDPHCPTCGGLADDSPDAARITLQPAPKLGPERYRVRDLSAGMDDLLRTYVDAEHGLIRALQRTTLEIYPTMMAPIGLPGNPPQTESGSGRELDYRTARLTAIAEAVERYGGVRPGGRRTVVEGSYRELAEQALDPGTLGLYPEDRHALPGFGYERYTEDLRMRWVWGHSFARGGPVLVPESCAYYRLHLASNDFRPFVYEISNGCALGSCLEEAILHGMLELAERDAFLMTWYAKLPVRRLDLNSARDRTIPLMAARLKSETVCDIHVFDTTTEQGIPSVWAMAVAPGDDESRLKTVCAAGAGLVPEKAVAGALLELAPILQWRQGSYAEDVDRARQMVADPDQVRSMHDHTVLYSHPAAFDRFGFLFESDRVVPIEESFGGAFRTRADDLRDDLTATLDRYLGRGLDVVVVDQTTAEHTAGGFRCVKVLIPGLLPMTFGHRYRRVDGLPRLLTVPHELGYYDRPLRADELNPHPHPFP